MVLGLRKSKPAVAEPRPDWPDVNDLVWLRLPCCETAIHPSRTEDFDGNHLVIAAPVKPHDSAVPAPEAGKAFVLGWRSGPASKQVRVNFVDEASSPVPTWTLSAVNEVETVQNRRFVRAPWDAPVSLSLPGVLDPVEGKILDISEGGIRCAIPARDEPRYGYFTVSFEFEGNPQDFDVEIAWWATPGAETVQVGLSFVGVDDPLSNRLRQHVFALQTEERRRMNDL